MDSLIQLHAKGVWHSAAIVAVTGGRVRFEYLPDYVFGEQAWPVALSLPVNMTIASAPSGEQTTPLAFLWDLVPQGRGRRYLADQLRVPEQDPGQDLFLAQHGAFAPIGRLRLDTACRFYDTRIDPTPAPGFTLDDMLDRTDVFLEQLAVHSMLAAGTPGVQGVAPKFLLTQDEDDRWFPDSALPDHRAHKHWIVKLPRGRHATDERILRHEALYLQAAATCGLRTIETPMYRENMLFLPRFDRIVDAEGVTRVHQETLASLTGATGFARSASMFALTKRLAEVVTDPATEIAEFVCRDVLNRALRNPDNHLRNTSVQQQPDGTVRLAPLYDLAPMYLDREVITRTCVWRGTDNRVLDDWNAILDQLQVDDDIKSHVACALKGFGEDQLPSLCDHLHALEADADVVEACRPQIEHQIQLLQEIDYVDQATPRP